MRRTTKRPKRETVPDYLRSTYDLITGAFPAEIDPDLYLPLLNFLEPHLSHRNLAAVIWLATGRDYALAWSDVVDAMGTPVSDEVLTRMRQRLEPHGLTAWLAES